MSVPQAVLLDFDGTICELFEGFDFAPLRAKLAQTMNDVGLGHLSEIGGPFSLPLAVRDALAEGPTLQHTLADVDDCLVEAEVAAAHDAQLVRGFRHAVARLQDADVALAVVTNNSPLAVRQLVNDRVPEMMNVIVVGRVPGRPELMKPNPWSLTRALGSLGVAPAEALMVGDSTADVVAAQSIGCGVIGIATKPYRRARLARLLAPDLIVRDHLELVDVLGL